MGVYHLMGLGRSPGAITGPLSYLGHRYQRWNEDDQAFFARSGEIAHRQAGQKVGDVQAIVLFTTREVLQGKDETTGREMLSLDYVDNPPGRIIAEPKHPGKAMKPLLRQLLGKILPNISGERSEVDLFWCEIDRRDIRSTFERIARVVAALAGVGGQGKEIWMNLTGGNNVSNFALELAATLSGAVARLYYVQAENQAAEKCIRYTAENGYWVDLPVMPLAISRPGQATLEILTEKGQVGLETLRSTLMSHEKYWNLIQGLSKEDFRETYLTPMWKQGLIVGDDNNYSVGPQWELVRPYQEVLVQTHTKPLTIEVLAQLEPWLEREPLTFHKQGDHP
jgi:hypothetical protein